MDKVLLITIKFIQSASKGSKPEIAGGIFCDGSDCVVAYARCLKGVVPIMGKRATFVGVRVKAIQSSLFSAKPEGSHTVEIDGPYIIITQAVRVIGIMPVADEVPVIHLI